MFTGLSIGRLAKATGTAGETVRYHEKIGLIPPAPRTAGNYRSYGRQDVARLSFVRRARALGFSLEQVRSLLELAEHREQSCAQVDAMARQKLDDVDAKIVDLTALRQELASLISQCEQGSIAGCRIVEALGPES